MCVCAFVTEHKENIAQTVYAMQQSDGLRMLPEHASHTCCCEPPVLPMCVCAFVHAIGGHGRCYKSTVEIDAGVCACGWRAGQVGMPVLQFPNRSAAAR